MNQTERFEIMEKVKSFPGISGAVSKIFSLLDDPDTDASRIEDVVRYDPGLTANILKMSNSAYFGFSGKIGSVRQAVVLLGWKRTAQIVIASCVNAMMDEPVSGYNLQKGEFWRHSIAVSVAAEGLVKELKLPDVEKIFTAALLHDIGKLVLGAFLKKDMEKVEIEAARGVSFEIAERNILGTDHAEIGAMILKNWMFPPGMVSAVRWHHDPDSAGDISVLTDIVHVANVLCLMIGVGVGREGLRYKPSPLATKRLGLTTGHLEMVASQTLQWVDDLSDMFV